jgi:hypothetical protein
MTRNVTFPEWCELKGTSTFEMAAAQEQAEIENWEEWIVAAKADRVVDAQREARMIGAEVNGINFFGE